ncbi:olfactory receptor class A-like protein 1 [Protopterus annectens]|uniref:olfactory receptor class A-like protein 1 n=1 Tax=Protopterus annectens TaxID=7888 RepID=UPI001CFABCB8|nr:olfactory receptor class A-like protein 1 [Protopterus annectens]
MELNDIVKGTFFLVIVIVGIPGNLTIMGSLSWIALTTFKLLPVEIIIWHLAVANAILAFTRGLPAALFILFRFKVNSDAGCIILLYLARISRGLAICFTCVLSCVQCITIIPSTSKWVYLKVLVSRHVSSVALSVWPLYMMMEIAPIFVARAVRNFTNSEFTFNSGYCLSTFPTALMYHLNGFGLFSRDLIVVAVMTLASVYILFILFKHRKQVNNMRTCTSSQNIAAEIRAAKTVVSLVTMYVLFFGVENTIWLYQIAGSTVVHSIVTDVRHFFSVCYTLFFPVAITTSNKKIQNILKCFYEHDNGKKRHACMLH